MIIRNAILFGMISWAALVGCAQGVKYLATGLTYAHGAMEQAGTLMASLDAAYAVILAKQQGPTEPQATRALAVADAVAQNLKIVQAGKEVSDHNLNLLAGQVDGVKAIAEKF